MHLQMRENTSETIDGVVVIIIIIVVVVVIEKLKEICTL